MKAATLEELRSAASALYCCHDCSHKCLANQCQAWREKEQRVKDKPDGWKYGDPIPGEYKGWCGLCTEPNE